MVFINRQFYFELSPISTLPPNKVKLGIVTKSSAMVVAIRYGVRTVPDLLFFKDGEVKDQFIGSKITKEQMRAKLEAL